VAYRTRGSFGNWCVRQGWVANYLYACAEFGTYDPIAVLGALRAENQAHHWSTDASAATRWAKHRLLERFCPASPSWRAQTGPFLGATPTLQLLVLGRHVADVDRITHLLPLRIVRRQTPFLTRPRPEATATKVAGSRVICELF